MRRQLHLDRRHRFASWPASGMESIGTEGPVEDVDALPTSPCDRHRRMFGTTMETTIQLRLVCTGHGFGWCTGLVGCRGIASWPRRQQGQARDTGDTSIVCPVDSIQSTILIFEPPGALHGHL